jgi:hypothetical protein
LRQWAEISLEDEHRRRVDHGGNRPDDCAALGLVVAALRDLLLGLLLALLDLFAAGAALTTLRFTGKRRSRQTCHQ